MTWSAIRRDSGFHKKISLGDADQVIGIDSSSKKLLPTALVKLSDIQHTVLGSTIRMQSELLLRFLNQIGGNFHEHIEKHDGMFWHQNTPLYTLWDHMHKFSSPLYFFYLLIIPLDFLFVFWFYRNAWRSYLDFFERVSKPYPWPAVKMPKAASFEWKSFII